MLKEEALSLSLSFEGMNRNRNSIRAGEFVGVSLEDSNRSWTAHLQGDWHYKSMHKINWSPSAGFLKLNFDGSYFQHINMGGISGVIRDSSGNVVKNFLGPMSSLDSNGAEVYAY